MTNTPVKATVSMVGTRPLFVEANLQAILGVVEPNDRFTPSAWSLEERRSNPYSRSALLERLALSGKPLPQTDLYLRRKTAPSYSMTLALAERPWISLECDKLPASDRAAFFALGDKLAAAFQPDLGAVHLWVGLRDEDQIDEPFANEDEQDAELMMYAATHLPVQYYKQGPTGLAMRTYIGPHFARQFGAERLDSLPVPVEQQPGGGYRIDLAPRPWEAELPTLLDGWRKAMAQLAPADVFAIPDIDEGQIDFSKGKRVDIGGIVKPNT
jgi:hypothetical protein